MRRPDLELFEAWKRRWEVMVRAAGAEPFSLTTEWRLVVGLGRKGPLEVGFTFNRYGFPVLPGSSLKGLARAWGLVVVHRALGFESLELDRVERILATDEDPKYREAFLGLGAFSASPGVEETGAGTQSLSQSDEDQVPLVLADKFRAIFGTTGRAGGAVFSDAIPVRWPHLELDVMNPHYAEYYQGKEPPAPWLSPRPIYFLTVAAGTEFRFAVGWRGPWDEKGRELSNLAKEWLVAGLKNLGAGAKTSAGYGYLA
jgi:CRISPR-associated protein Cmr6